MCWMTSFVPMPPPPGILLAEGGEGIEDEVGGRGIAQLAIGARIGRAAMPRAIDEIHVEARSQEVIQPAITAVRGAHPVGGLTAAAMYQHQRIRVALLRGQLKAHVHLAVDGRARRWWSKADEALLNLRWSRAHPEETLVAQADGPGFAASGGGSSRQEGRAGQQCGRCERAPSNLSCHDHFPPFSGRNTMLPCTTRRAKRHPLGVRTNLSS